MPRGPPTTVNQPLSSSRNPRISRISGKPIIRPLVILLVDISIICGIIIRILVGQDLRFGGLSIDETAATLGISPATVKREWVTARAWLLREMARPGADLPSARRADCSAAAPA